MNHFDKLKAKARENEVIREYLDSFSSQMGQEIFKLRVNKKMTQKELSELAGVTQTTISRIEAGDPGIKGETCNKVLKALKAPKINLQAVSVNGGLIQYNFNETINLVFFYLYSPLHSTTFF